jgi:hypothetical protein
MIVLTRLDSVARAPRHPPARATLAKACAQVYLEGVPGRSASSRVGRGCQDRPASDQLLEPCRARIGKRSANLAMRGSHFFQGVRVRSD